jgi:hypothetical protein
MKTRWSRPLITCFALVGITHSSLSHAGPYTDALAKCLVDSTTVDDRSTLVRWMFAAASAHPAVASIANVTPAQLDEMNRVTANLFVNLLTESCPDVARDALQFEGQSAIEGGFNVLGQVAGRELFSAPEVAGSLAGLERHVDTNKLQKLMPQKK